jgi:hypothetical protein
MVASLARLHGPMHARHAQRPAALPACLWHGHARRQPASSRYTGARRWRRTIAPTGASRCRRVRAPAGATDRPSGSTQCPAGNGSHAKTK